METKENGMMLEILTVRFLSELGWPGSVSATRSAVVWLLVRFVSVLFPGGGVNNAPTRLIYTSHLATFELRSAPKNLSIYGSFDP